MKRTDKEIKAYLNRLFPTAPDSVVDEAGERILKNLYALEPERAKAFRFVPRDASESISPQDQAFLAAIQALAGEGYSSLIMRKVTEMTLRKTSLAKFYLVLNRLEKKGLVTTERRHDGVLLRRFCTITESGERLLADLAAHQAAEELAEARIRAEVPRRS